jgi:hypothetical protein
MAIALGQRAIWSWTDKDSTERLNEKFRAVLSPGVYFGLYAIPDQTGVGGLNINLMLPRDEYMDQYYGILSDNSMTVIQEVQDDWYASGLNTDPGYLLRDHDGTTPPDEPTWIGNVAANTSGNPRIDAVVCRHEYLPEVVEASNLANYYVLAGTPAADPDPPALDADDIVLAYIDVPDGTTTITADLIRNVTPIGPAARSDITYWQNVVEPGIYNGLDIGVHSSGTPTAPFVNISAGSILTKQGWKITEDADLNLNLGLTNAGGAALTKIVYVIMAHKYDDIFVPTLPPDPDDPGFAIPAPDYLIVDGSAVASDGTEGDAPIPTGTQIRAALAAIDSKYDTDDYMDYVNMLGAVTVTGTSPGYFYETSEPKKVLPRDMSVWLTPYRPDTYGFPSGPLAHLGFWGIDDLEWLLEQIVERNNNTDPLDVNENKFQQPYRIELHGLALLPTPLSVPSHVTLEGPAILLSPYYRDAALTEDAIDASGYSAIGNTSNTVFLATYNGAIDANFDSYTIAIQPTYQTGRPISKRRFIKGDELAINKGDGNPQIAAYFDEMVSDWSFKVWCWNGDDPTLKESADALIIIRKERLGLSGIRAFGNINMDDTHQSTLRDVVGKDVSINRSTWVYCDNLTANGVLTAKATQGLVLGVQVCRYILFGRTFAADFDLDIDFGTINHLGVPQGMAGTGSIFTLTGTRTLVGNMYYDGETITLDTLTNTDISFIQADDVSFEDCDKVTVNLVEGNVACDSDCSQIAIQDVTGTFDDGGVWSNIVIGQFYRATGTATFAGGSSSVTVDFGVVGIPDMPNANYSVHIDYATPSSGEPDVGEIWIDKTTGDFTVTNTGENATDTFRWTLTYREP